MTDSDERWRVAAHEAGHMITAKILFGAEPSGRIWSGGYGIAFNLDGPAESDRRGSAEFRSLAKRLALLSMAGLVATELVAEPADLPAVPKAPKPVASETRGDEPDVLFSTLLRLETDEVRWEQCCDALVRHRQYHAEKSRGPRTVAGQVFRMYQVCRRMLRKPRHQSEIERIARELFARGIYSPPARPAD
jgi:hypothetical protein